ncbi:division/cell wall cluster transcriptional repressor MraZ [Candidatus Gottesmanbacteria bacterium]|nr:division/cell wall cluster transcriptional repressor MraZ [Candidatus Gottesmanbacteria bacterium]
MFLGTYEHNLMEEGRIALPKKLRNALGGQRLIVRIGLEPCIVGFRESDWIENTKGELARPFFSDKEGRDIRRKIFSDAEYAELDNQGRFVLPRSMINHARIRDKVTIIGAGDHFEIWETKIWQAYQKGLTN